MTFRVGMPVRCVDGYFHALARVIYFMLGIAPPVKDRQYTIEKCGLIVGGQSGVVLVETKNISLMLGAWRASRFRPLMDTKSEVSFTAGAPKDSEKWDGRRERVINVSRIRPRFPLPEADVPARREECLPQHSGHDHD